MYIMYRTMNVGLAPCFSNPGSVNLLFSIRQRGLERWTTFVNDLLKQGSKNNQSYDHDLNQQLLLLVAKDKKTMVRGLAFAGGSKVLCAGGTIVMYRGHYSNGVHEMTEEERREGFGGGMPVSTPSVFRAMHWNVKKGFGLNKVCSTKEIRNGLNHRRLEEKGYYVCLAPQSALTGQYVGAGETFVGDNSVDYKTISTLLNHNHAVSGVGRTGGFRETLLQKFANYLNQIKERNNQHDELHNGSLGDELSRARKELTL